MTVEAADTLDPATLAATLRTRVLGRVHEHHVEIDSTQTWAQAWAEAGAPHGALVTADAQRAGRGRRGRGFVSPAGTGIYASVVLRGPRRWAEGPLSLVVGLAIAEGIAGVGVAGLRLKWPNDLVLAGGKAGGILCEVFWQGECPTVTAGFGINVHAAPNLGPQAPYRATCLADVAGTRLPGRAAILASVLGRLEDLLDAYGRSGFAGLRPRYLAHSCTVGRIVEIEDGSERARVRVVDVADTGELVVRGPGGGRLRRIAAGEVSLPLDAEGC